MTCFKKIDNSAEVYFRKVVKNEHWAVAQQTDVQGESSGTFLDSNGNPHYLREIASVGFLGLQIYPIYLYNGIVNGEQTYTYVEVDDKNAHIIRQYIKSKLCEN